jgi:hypothetical protein
LNPADWDPLAAICDPCIANKIVNGKQLTICWHVDDLKILHVDPDVITRFITWLKKNFETIFNDGSGTMKITRGKIHEYLGMTLDFSTPGELKISMIPYIKEIIAHFDKHDHDTTKIAKTRSLPMTQKGSTMTQECVGDPYLSTVVTLLILYLLSIRTTIYLVNRMTSELMYRSSSEYPIYVPECGVSSFLNFLALETSFLEQQHSYQVLYSLF